MLPGSHTCTSYYVRCTCTRYTLCGRPLRSLLPLSSSYPRTGIYLATKDRVHPCSQCSQCVHASCKVHLQLRCTLYYVVRCGVQKLLSSVRVGASFFLVGLCAAYCLALCTYSYKVLCTMYIDVRCTMYYVHRTYSARYE